MLYLYQFFKHFKPYLYSMRNVTGIPVDNSNKYATVSDVERYLRSFEFDSTSNPSTSDVESIIEQKTRQFEQSTPTSYRELKVENKEFDVNPTYDQQYDEIGERIRRYKTPTVGNSDRRQVKVRLPNTDIIEVQSIETITDNEEGYTTVDTSEYYLDEEQGVLRIDINQFNKTVTGTSYNNVLDDARIRISYTYGRTSYLEPEVTEAIAKLTVYDIVNSDAFGVTLSEDDFFIEPSTYTDRIKQEADDIISKYKHGGY